MAIDDVEDQVFLVRDGWFCIVSGRTYGPRLTKHAADVLMADQQYRRIMEIEKKPPAASVTKLPIREHIVAAALIGGVNIGFSMPSLAAVQMLLNAEYVTIEQATEAFWDKNVEDPDMLIMFIDESRRWYLMLNTVEYLQSAWPSVAQLILGQKYLEG